MPMLQSAAQRAHNCSKWTGTDALLAHARIGMKKDVPTRGRPLLDSTVTPGMERILFVPAGKTASPVSSHFFIALAYRLETMRC